MFVDALALRGLESPFHGYFCIILIFKILPVLYREMQGKDTILFLDYHTVNAQCGEVLCFIFAGQVKSGTRGGVRTSVNGRLRCRNAGEDFWLVGPQAVNCSIGNGVDFVWKCC